ncbi:MAG: CRISPR-associated protein Cas4 [Thermoplasmatota archaeon]
MSDKWISASDVEKYGYCPLSWWLSEEEEEVESETLKEGSKQHQEIGEKIDDIKSKEESIRKLENIILWLAVLATVISIMGITFLYPENLFSNIFIINSLVWILAAAFLLYASESRLLEIQETKLERMILIFAMIATVLAVYGMTFTIADYDLAKLAQIVSLIWLIGASYWLKISLTLQKETRTVRDEMNLEDQIAYVDNPDKEPDMLSSEKYKLRGRPDFIIEREGKKVPVEVKTGRVPKGPFFSHIVQLATYCVLIEEEYDTAPPYGIIRYGETEFEIDYDDDLKELLLSKLEDMREAQQTRDIHRNHNRKGKCRNCSRRDLCSESLV